MVATQQVKATKNEGINLPSILLCQQQRTVVVLRSIVTPGDHLSVKLIDEEQLLTGDLVHIDLQIIQSILLRDQGFDFPIDRHYLLEVEKILHPPGHQECTGEHIATRSLLRLTLPLHCACVCFSLGIWELRWNAKKKGGRMRWEGS